MTDVVTAPQQGWTLWLVAAAQFVLQLDLAIINVALPTVQRELGFSPAGLQWVVTGYALTFGSLLLFGGRLGDRVGHRRALIAGLVVFGLSSVSGGLAMSPSMLVASRLIQGVGAASVAPAALALLSHAYTESRERARAMGIFQGAVAGGALAGILAGGLLTEFVGWRWVLLVNPPIILVLVLLVRRRVLSPRGDRGVSLDLAGALTATAAIAALIVGVSRGESWGYADPAACVLLALFLLLSASFVLIERRASDPMVPRALLTGRRVTVLTAVLVLGAVLSGYVYFASLYLQRVHGFTPGLTGLALVPATGTVLVMSTQVSRRLLRLVGTGWQLALALGLMGAGQLWFAGAPEGGSYVAVVLGPLVTTSAGIGLALPAASLAVIRGAPAHHRGVAGALFASGQQIGSAVGLAFLAAVAAARTSVTGRLVDGYDLAFLAAGILAAASAIGIALQQRRHRPVSGPSRDPYVGDGPEMIEGIPRDPSL